MLLRVLRSKLAGVFMAPVAVPLAVAAAMALLPACGYSLRTTKTSNRLANRGIQRIYVHPIANNTYRAGVENTVFNAVLRAIGSSAVIRAVSSPERADAEFFGTVTRVERPVTSLIKADDLNPKGLGSPNILVATEYLAVMECRFELKLPAREGRPAEQVWSGGFSRSRPFPGNNQLWTLGSTSALINESELDRTLVDVAELMTRDVVQSMLEDF